VVSQLLPMTGDNSPVILASRVPVVLPGITGRNAHSSELRQRTPCSYEIRSGCRQVPSMITGAAKTKARIRTRTVITLK
jgi:hypothetical protein